MALIEIETKKTNACNFDILSDGSIWIYCQTDQF